MKIRYALLAALFTPLMSSASVLETVYTDPENDIHHNMAPACGARKDTDIVKTEFLALENEYQVIFHLAAPVNQKAGYKEYYAWVEVNPEDKIGYQPYNPYSVAWPDLYADFRVMLAIEGAEHPLAPPSYRVLSQDCKATDCSKDDGLKANSRIKAKVEGNIVKLAWSKAAFKDLKGKQSVKVGYTSFYDHNFCNGEDDSPQWGENAHDVELDNTVIPH